MRSYGWTLIVAAASAWALLAATPVAKADENVAVLGIESAEGDLEFHLKAAAFTVPGVLPKRSYSILANRVKVGTWIYEHGAGVKDQVVRIPARLLRPDGMLVLELRTVLSPSPAELGISEDPRRLGLLVRDWQLLPKPKS